MTGPPSPDPRPHDEPSGEALVRLRRISKRFPGVQALEEVSLDLHAGTIHALVGENGAGKSTLGKVLGGLYAPDSGTLELDGQPVVFAHPGQALRAGIALVHQELSFCENLTVAENLALEAMPRRGPWFDRERARRQARRWLDALSLDVSVDALVGDLTVGVQQLIQIAGAIGRGARVLIFDEPTSSLSRSDVDHLFAQIRRLRAEGVAIVYVSHRLDELFELCDLATVLRDGRFVATRSMSDLTRSILVSLMIGRDVEPAPEPAGASAQPVLQVRALTSPRKLFGIDFTVHAGEIVGLAGLMGSGRTPIAEALFGLDPHAQGEMIVNRQLLRAGHPDQAIAAGIGLVPEDRKRQALVPNFNGRENLSLAMLPRLATGGWVRPRAERLLTRDLYDRLRVRPPDPELPALGLSGGNQQKLILARWLATGSPLLILDEPTRGVDVGAKAEIHSLIRDLAASGRAILLLSSELPELLALSHRILVVRQGRLVGEVPRADADEAGLMRLMAGVSPTASPVEHR